MLSLSLIHPVTGQLTDYPAAKLRAAAVAAVKKRGRLTDYGVTVDGTGAAWLRFTWQARDGWSTGDAVRLVAHADPQPAATPCTCHA